MSTPFDTSALFESTAYKEASEEWARLRAEAYERRYPRFPTLPKDSPHRPLFKRYERPKRPIRIVDGWIVVDQEREHGEWLMVRWGSTFAYEGFPKFGKPTLLASSSTMAEMMANHLAEAYRPEGVP